MIDGRWWVALLALAHVATASAISFAVPFPSEIDELHHYSYIRQMVEAPALFPDHRAMVVVAPDLSGWSSTASYLNHPSLYYLLMAPVFWISDGSVLVLRLANVALSSVALIVAARAALRLFQTSGWGLYCCAAIFAYPKAPVVGGMINNDNLTLLGGALLLAGLIRGEAGILQTSASLSIAGWGKLTALLMTTVTVLAWRLSSIRHVRRLVSAKTFLLCAAAAIGATPYLATLMTEGRLLVVSDTHNYVPPDLRPDLSFADYAGRFFGDLAVKWAALEGRAADSLSGLLIVGLAAYLPATGLRRDLAVAYCAGLLVSLLCHLVFGWHAFCGSET